MPAKKPAKPAAKPSSKARAKPKARPAPKQAASRKPVKQAPARRKARPAAKPAAPRRPSSYQPAFVPPPAAPPGPPPALAAAPSPAPAPSKPARRAMPRQRALTPVTQVQVGARLEQAAAGVDLPNLIKWLANVTDEPRMEKTVKMLKKATFQLFADLGDDELVGVVRSQREADLFYSCSIRSDGHFCCVNQLMELCLGMQGYPCKHLMVLMVGLAQAGRMSPNTIRAWVTRTASLPARLRVQQDPDKLSATFLRYQGSQAGELDWRPTETLPEDFYAL